MDVCSYYPFWQYFNKMSAFIGITCSCCVYRWQSILSPWCTSDIVFWLRRLVPKRAASDREMQAGSRPALREIIKQCHVYRRPMIIIFNNSKVAFEPVTRFALVSVLANNLFENHSISQTQGQINLYGEHSKSFPANRGDCRGCPSYLFLFNFVTDEIMKRTPNGLQYPVVAS